MKIVFLNRKDCFTQKGGDTIQMLKTKEYLEKNHGCKIDICLEPIDILNHTDCDLIHIFNIQTYKETLEFIKYAKMINKKIALSTIYWDLSDFFKVNRTFKVAKVTPFNPFFKFISNILDKLIRIFIKEKSYLSKKYKYNITKIMNNVDIILPNSLEELKIISKQFNLDLNNLQKKSSVVINATDIENFKVLPISNSKLKNYVLQVGRIEPIKNQYATIKALENEKEIPIVFIGKIIDKDYYKKLEKISSSRGNVYFIEEIDHEKLVEYYNNAIVHVLPSFRESPGLVTLEAICCGSQVVVSNEKYCPIKTYNLDEKGFICDPYNIESLRTAILKAINEPKRYDLKEYKNKISYELAAKQTYQAYMKEANDE